MDTTVVTVLAAIGLALATEALVRMFFKLKINVSAANAVLLKLVAEDNLDRAVKLTAVVPGTYFDAIGAALSAGLEVAARDVVTIGAATHAAFDKAAAVVDLRWRSAAERGQVGAVLAVAAALWQVATNERTTAVTTVAGLAVIAGIWHTFHKPDMAAALARGRTEVLPAIDRALTKREDKVS